MSTQQLQTQSDATLADSSAVARAEVVSTGASRPAYEDIHIGASTSASGSYETDGTLFVDGTLTNAKVKVRRLSVSLGGSMQGEADVDTAEIVGTFNGRLSARGEVVLRSLAQVSGQILCSNLVIHRGAVLKGEIDVIPAEGQPRRVPVNEPDSHLSSTMRTLIARWRRPVRASAWLVAGVAVAQGLSWFAVHL